MGQTTNEVKQLNIDGNRPKRGGGSALLIALGLTAAIMAGAYGGLCAWAGSRTVFYPGETIHGVAVGGLTVDEAAQVLAGALPEQSITIVSAQTAEEEGWSEEAEPVSVTLKELGYTPERCPDISRRHFEEQSAAPFFSRGAQVLSVLTAPGEGGLTAKDRDEDVFREGLARLSEELSREPADGTYEMTDSEILLTKEANGRTIGTEALTAALEGAVSGGQTEVQVEFTTREATPLSIQEIHEAISGEMKNASYDAASDTIIPEQIGASFDTVSAQRMLSGAAPGETVSVPADIQQPEITAEELEAVLFRDMLGECTTRVTGTAARISNVKLASAAFDGTVLNSGDVFSYNETVGQRTVEKGYKAAPAYVQGETVDEIGGGVCQPSSTLYYACLLANMEITQRYAHRYIPSYITRGMDATVSWGGPDYKFTNNTKYPLRISAVYDKGNLTVQLWGTKTDNLTVKMTYETLSTTPFKDVEQEDPSLEPGVRQVKVTPYTGCKVRTYRNIFDGSGALVSSEVEAISDYKHRDRLTLVGPAKPADEVETGTVIPGVPGIPVEEPPASPDGAGDPAGIPSSGPADIPDEPAVPEEPPAVVVISPPEE